MSTASTRIELEPEDEHDRYHRQSLITWWDQSLLNQARMLVVGAGALGNEIVKNLALMGVGHITVIDLDRVENSNLSRCVFFRASDDGRPKSEVLAERVRELNPNVDITALVGDVRMNLGLGMFAEADVVLGGLDNREARLFVNQACWKTSTPWIDGAIEGLMGVVRVFVPPHTACYECTLGERDRELMAARRTCALLTREEMLAGRTPTTATSSSVIAGMQVQEAIKLLHAERIGPPTLAGGAFQFVGLTHDSYVVRYTRKEECLSHDTYDIEQSIRVAGDASFGEILALARERLGQDAVLELEHEIVLAASCQQCNHREEIRRPAESLTSGAGLCVNCANPWRLEFTHSIDDSSPLLSTTAPELGLPDHDIVVARSGVERSFYILEPITTSQLDGRSTAGAAG